MLPLPKKAVTEADLKATEARLAESFTRLKSSITRIPGDVTRPVTDTVKEHPYLTVAAAAGAGFVAYGLLNAIVPKTKVVKREVTIQPQVEIKEKNVVPMRSKLLSEAISFATPYVTSYLQSEISRITSKGEPEEKTENIDA